MRVSAKTWLPLVGVGLAALCLAGAARAADADKLVPSDAEVVASVNVRKLLDSDLFKKYGQDAAKAGLQDPNAKKLLGAMGLDPLKDIESILVTSAGTEKPKMLVVARGKFDVSKIQTAAENYAKDKPDDLKINKVHGLTIYEGKGNGDQKVFAHLVGDGKTLMASTDQDYLVQAVQTPSGGPSKQMQNALSKVSGKDEAWVAAVITAEMNKQIAGNPQTKDLADKLEAITGTIDVSSDVQINLTVHTTDATSAGSLKKQLNQVKPLLTLMAQSNEDAAPIVQDLLDNLKITSDQTSVKVSLKVSQELIEKASKQDKKPDLPPPPPPKDKPVPTKDK
jgi:hypothetical protein